MTIIDQGNGAAGAAAADLIKDTTTQTFVKDVIEESKRQPVLIDFWAEWCGPCKQLTPVLEKAVKAAKGKVKLVKMNIDQHPAIPGQMGIQSIPAVIAFVNGQPADGFMGAVPESQVNAFIEKVTKGVTAPGEPNIAEILQEAEAVLAEGDAAAAAQIYAEVLQHDSTNIAALAGLAKCYAVSGAMEQAKQTLAMVPESQAQRPRREGRADRDRSRRAGGAAGAGGRAGTESRRKPARSSGTLRPCDRAECARQPGGGHRAVAGDHQARPQVERRRRPQAARAILRGVGWHG
ncbi:thioredoxin [Bradyrhizobium sp. i1.4.4]